MFHKLAKLFSAEGPSPTPTKPWPEEALAEIPFSVHGLRLGQNKKQVSAIIREANKATPVCWRWGPHDMSSAIFCDERVEELWGTSLEKHGATVLRQGDSLPAVHQTLGENPRVFAFREATEKHLLYDLPPFVLDISLTTEAAHGSLEHERILASDDVVDRVFHISLKIQR